jgi:hypothetical protein
MLKLLAIIAIASIVSANLNLGVNPTHYGNPTGGCLPDEIAARITGVTGDACLPECTTSACPTDYPQGDTAPGECAVSGPNHKKYCILECKGSFSGTCPTGAACIDVAGGKVGICLYDSGIPAYLTP